MRTRGSRRLRRAAALVAGLLVATLGGVGILAWRRLDDWLPAAVQAAASSAGLALEARSVSLAGGWELLLGGVTLGSIDGGTLMEAAAVRATPSLGLAPPGLRLALEVDEARFEAGGGEGGGLLDSLALPAAVSSLSMRRLRIGFAGGTAVDLDLVARTEASGALAARIGGLGFADEASGLAAEKVRGEVWLGAPDSGRARRLRVRVDGGAALAGPVLLDFEADPFEAAANVSEGEDGSLRLDGLVATLGALVELRGELALDAQADFARAAVVLRAADLGPPFAAFVRDPFGGVAPALADATLAGSMDLEVSLLAPPTARRGEADAWLRSLEARLRVRDGALRTRSVDLKGLDLDLPWSGAAFDPGARRKGRLRAAGLSILDLPFGGLDIELEAVPERLAAKFPIELRAFDGEVHLGAVLLERRAREGLRLSADLRLEGLDLALLGAAAGAAGIPGSLGGDLGRVSLDPAALVAEGALRAEVFGGRIDLSRLALLDPFSRVPTFAVDAALTDIDLESLTATLPFGSVRGVLEGKVTNLRLAAGQPVSFEADLGTVRRRGVDQTIDVRAITQLGVLGGGDGGSLTGTLLKIFDRYRYSKLGIRCRLHNDVFEVRGVEREGGRDYLVRGGLLPPTVNVVSHSQVVSFSEMLRRVQRMTALGQGENDDGT